MSDTNYVREAYKVSHTTDAFIIVVVAGLALSRTYPDRYVFKRKHYADWDYENSPSGGWEFTNYVMRVS